MGLGLHGVAELVRHHADDTHLTEVLHRPGMNSPRSQAMALIMNRIRTGVRQLVEVVAADLGAGRIGGVVGDQFSHRRVRPARPGGSG